MYFMLFANNIHIYFSFNVHACVLIHTVDIYLTAVYINVYMIMIIVYTTAFACSDGYARTAILIADNSCFDYSYITVRLRIALTLITDSCY